MDVIGWVNYDWFGLRFCGDINFCVGVSLVVYRGDLPNLEHFLIFLMYTNMKHCRKETNAGIR
jgi:hypothetical protein